MSNTTVHFGATVDEWQHLSQAAILHDLLPVVSNPTAKLAETSTLKAIGKVPSRYNMNRALVGISKWTTYHATPQDIERWATEYDYGICIQTRTVRALDIDVEDAETAANIVAFVEDFLMFGLPKRGRADSTKCLLAFQCLGALPKRVFKCKGGMVEFLGNGQQFIAAGTHPKGSRYTWHPAMPWFPMISVEVFEKLWDALVRQFATEDAFVGEHHPRNSMALTTAMQDNVIDKLDVISFGREGQAFIECPFSLTHSSSPADGSPSATAYFPAGTRGYQQGHFKCLHASCAKRTDADFLDALGIRAAQFDVVPVTPHEAVYTPPRFYRDRMGKILPTIVNLKNAFRCPTWLGVQIRKDSFTDSIVINAVDSDRKPKVFRDVDYTRLREVLELKGFLPVPKEIVRDVVHDIAEEFWFDSAMDWLTSLEWDGVDRCKHFFKDCFGCKNDPEYLKAVSLYFWSALAGRILSPGCKADMVPILIGAQGVGKSFGIEHIAIQRDQYRLIDFHKLDDNLLRSMQGCNVLEIGEMRGLHTSAMEAIKAFVTRSEDAWVMKYQEFMKKIPRRSVFIGTGNDKSLLADPTGHRRWLPMDAGKVNLDLIVTIREQLWAEARVLYQTDLANGGHGVLWKEAQNLAPDIHADFTVEDEWQEPIARFLFTAPDKGVAPAYRSEGVSTQEICAVALGRHVVEMKRNESLRLAGLLRAMKFERVQIRDGEIRGYRWVFQQ